MALLLGSRFAWPSETVRDESIGIELPLLVLTGPIDRSPFAGGAILGLKTLKWDHFIWSPVEVGGAVYRWVDSDNDENQGTAFFAYLGSQPGLWFRFGDRGQHQLRLGIGAGLGVFGRSYRYSRGEQSEISGQAVALALSPKLGYRYEFESQWSLGGGFRILWPVAGIGSWGYTAAAVSPLVLLSLEASLLIPRPESGSAAPGPGLDRITEYLGVEITGLQLMLGPRGAHDPPATTGFGALLRVWTLRWQHFFVTPLEIGLGRMISDEIHSFFVGAHAGLPVCIDDGQRHCLAAGLGLGYGIFGGTSTLSGDDPWGMGGQGLMFSPALRYDYHFEGPLFVGAGMRMWVPLEADPPSSYGDLYGWGIQFFLDAGFTQTGYITDPEGNKCTRH